MKIIQVILVSILMVTSSCATATNFDAIGSSLSELNQKVTGYYYGITIPDDFDAVQYKKAVAEVCKNNPPCQEKAATIFSDYEIRARKIDNIFSVMICDKATGKKIMEDFSCSMKVEVPTYKTDTNAPCVFEKNWQTIINGNCPTQ